MVRVKKHRRKVGHGKYITVKTHNRKGKKRTRARRYPCPTDFITKAREEGKVGVLKDGKLIFFDKPKDWDRKMRFLKKHSRKKNYGYWPLQTQKIEDISDREWEKMENKPYFALTDEESELLEKRRMMLTQ